VVTSSSAAVVSVSNRLVARFGQWVVPPSIRPAARTSGAPRASLRVSRRSRGVPRM
jgi:hypothetical protein